MSDSATATDLIDAQPRTVAALIALGVLGVSVFLAMPAVVSALSQTFGFDDRQIGQFSFVQLSFVSLGCLLSLWLAPRYSLRTIATAALSALLLADLITPSISSYPLFLAVRAVAGVAGGVAIAAATGGLGRTARADMNFGWFLLTQIAFQMAANLLLPRLVNLFGLKGVFLTFGLIEAVVVVLLVKAIPTATLRSEPGGHSGSNSAAVWLRCVLVLLSILAFFIAVGAFWTFVGRIGESKGLTVEQVGNALGIAAIGGLTGAFLPALIGARLGRVVPVIMALAGLVAGIHFMSAAENSVSYIVATALFSFGWFLLYPFQLGTLAAIDRDGRPTILSAALTGIGLGIGPAIVAQLIEQGLTVAYTIATSCVVVAGALILGVLSSARAAREG